MLPGLSRELVHSSILTVYSRGIENTTLEDLA